MLHELLLRLDFCFRGVRGECIRGSVTGGGEGEVEADFAYGDGGRDFCTGEGLGEGVPAFEASAVDAGCEGAGAVPGGLEGVVGG